MATLTEVEAGLQTRLLTITGLDAYAEEPGSFAVPAAWPLPRENEYHETFAGTEVLTVDILIVVASDAVLRAEAQKMLDPYLSKDGTKSIKLAIEAADSLGGIVQTLACPRWFNRGLILISGVNYWCGMVEVQLWN